MSIDKKDAIDVTNITNYKDDNCDGMNDTAHSFSTANNMTDCNAMPFSLSSATVPMSTSIPTMNTMPFTSPSTSTELQRQVQLKSGEISILRQRVAALEKQTQEARMQVSILQDQHTQREQQLQRQHQHDTKSLTTRLAFQAEELQRLKQQQQVNDREKSNSASQHSMLHASQHSTNNQPINTSQATATSFSSSRTDYWINWISKHFPSLSIPSNNSVDSLLSLIKQAIHSIIDQSPPTQQKSSYVPSPSIPSSVPSSLVSSYSVLQGLLNALMEVKCFAPQCCHQISSFLLITQNITSYASVHYSIAALLVQIIIKSRIEDSHLMISQLVSLIESADEQVIQWIHRYLLSEHCWISHSSSNAAMPIEHLIPLILSFDDKSSVKGLLESLMMPCPYTQGHKTTIEHCDSSRLMSHSDCPPLMSHSDCGSLICDSHGDPLMFHCLFSACSSNDALTCFIQLLLFIDSAILTPSGHLEMQELINCYRKDCLSTDFILNQLIPRMCCMPWDEKDCSSIGRILEILGNDSSSDDKEENGAFFIQRTRRHADDDIWVMSNGRLIPTIHSLAMDRLIILSESNKASI